MTNQYTTSSSAHVWRKLALAALISIGATAAHAQALNYNAFGTQNTLTTYTDLGTTGTAIATENTDDANSAAQPIGFTFNYNGTPFTEFVLNTNGFIKLGNQAPSAANLYYTTSNGSAGDPITSTNPADVNVLLPFNHDLVDGTAPAEYRVATTGTAPNRICIIQWKNVSDKATGKQYANMQFQVKLYEGSNTIDFVYGTTVAGPGPNALKTSAIGIKGSANSVTQVITVTKASSTPWSQAEFLAGNYTVNAQNFRLTVLPDAGRTYRFQSVAATDATVIAIYSLGKLPIPYGAPHTIQAVVRNVGTTAMTNVEVTARVAGANTFSSSKTIPALAVNAQTTVSFDAFTPTVTGNETVTVSVGDDNIISNNAKTYEQVVSATTYAVAEPSKAISGSVGLNTTAGASSGLLAVKYTTSVLRAVTDVTVRLENAPSVGRTVYGVVCNSAGVVIARTPDYVIKTTDIGTVKTFTLASPVNVPVGEFFVGLAQAVSPAGTAAYYPVGLQSEVPTRTGTFYIMSELAGGAPTDIASNQLGRFMIEAITAAPASCAAPTAVSVASTSPTSATVTFTGPTNGTGYTIIYGPTGFNPATGGTTVTAATSPYTITGLAGATTYQVYIRTNCGTTDQSALAGPVSVTTPCVPQAITTFPYSENFDAVATGTLSCGVTVTDVNADQVSWQNRATVPGANGDIVIAASAPNAMTYYYNEDSKTPANDWFFTPALFLRTGNRYQLSFKYRNSGANFTEKLEVKYGSSASPASQTNALWTDTNIGTPAFLTANATSTIPVSGITPTTTGNYYIGFHVFSDADKFFLAIDDVQVTATVITGTSAALDYAISVFPNPSAGVFNLDIKGANAKGAMQVEVMNSLGQIVHTASVRDNQLNKLDLSNLAGGMYVLKVKSGNDFSVRNISVQK